LRYYAVDHDIVDKYESAPGVINKDIVTFKLEGKKYELMISISTLEDVGWNGTPRDRHRSAHEVHATSSRPGS
jgi:hypothetical protein